MPRVARALGALAVARLTAPGMHAVGEVAGLYLRVAASGARSWALRTTVGARRCELGLGGYPSVSLAQARERARKTLARIRDEGADPAAERRAARACAPWTFQRTAEAYISTHRAQWRNAKHAQQWGNTLGKYVYPEFGAKHVRDVTKADVLSVVEPLWATKHETAARLRSRIELVLRWAMLRHYRPEGPNPAEAKLLGLPRASALARPRHHAALGIDDMHALMLRLRQAQGMGARALEFVVLTAARSGEVRGALWSEIDEAAGVWCIPAERMKAARAHRVPLCTRALALLGALPRFVDCPLVFPSARGSALSDMTLTAVLRRLGVAATVHGFRSTFRDWAAERTSTPPEIAELALAHSIGTKTVEAYLRSDLFERRAELMQRWQRFLDTPPAKGNVRRLARDERGAA